MTRRILLLPLFAAAVAGFVKAQAASERVETVKYPVPGYEDAVAEVEAKDARAVLDDFYQSKVLEELHHAALENDAAKLDRLLGDHLTWTTERFGRGVKLTKAQVLADFRSGTLQVNTDEHNHVRFVVFGNTVIVSDISTSTLRYEGKASKGPRMSMLAWVKLDGRWQMAAHHVSDIEGGVFDRLDPNQFK